MAIFAGDIKLVASQVMDDVPEGGGAPTSTIILDGASNVIFPDISELDRAAGRVLACKTHVSVQTPGQDTYMGCNVIVATPPADPNVSITLLATGGTFDRRDAAVAYMEAYATRSLESGLTLMGHHAVGMQQLIFYMDGDRVAPDVGQVLVLIENEGLVTEKMQYVRVTSAVVADLTPQRVTTQTSEPLRFAFTGTESSLSPDVFTKVTKVSTTRQAGTFAGVTPLLARLEIGDLSAQAGSIYTRLVPSTQAGLPLADYSADLIQIDMARLPADGLVRMFNAGGFVVIGNTQSVTATVSNGQVIDCARVRLSRVRVVGHDGIVINTGYSADLEAGLVSISDVTGWAQPVRIENRIEDMLRLGTVTGRVIGFTRPVTHDYPVEGSYISTALIAGDLRSRVPTLFDQGTWNGLSWTDTLVGNAATGTYNDILAPVIVTNVGAMTERWCLRFTSSTAFDILGEHVGVLGTGSINMVTNPINPATGEPYFTLPILGWGLGWAAGNVLRFNTVGAMFPVWVVRTIQQGAESVQDDSFTLLVRGDVNRP